MDFRSTYHATERRIRHRRPPSNLYLSGKFGYIQPPVTGGYRERLQGKCADAQACCCSCAPLRPSEDRGHPGRHAFLSCLAGVIRFVSLPKTA